MREDGSPNISMSTMFWDSLVQGGVSTPSVLTVHESNGSLRRSHTESFAGSDGRTAHQNFQGFPVSPVGLTGQSTAYQPLHSPSSPAQSRSENATPSTSGTVGGTLPQKASESPISWWWWWEIGAGLLSTSSMVLLLVALFKANNLALASWKL